MSRPSRLSHLSKDGTARMVDVSGKQESKRKAVAEGNIAIDADALTAIREGNGPKGDVIGTARLVGIMAAKRTGDLIPLCHPLALDAINVDCAFEQGGIRVTATASLTGRTGVEMEALTAVSVTLLTIYDMAKAIDKTMTIGGIRLLSKSGGKSGDWQREL